MFNGLQNGIAHQHNARKIRDFLFLFALAQIATVMLIFQAAVIVIICATTIEKTYWAGLVSLIVIFSFWSVNYIAIDLEERFGDDANDLPVLEMQMGWNGRLISLMHELAQIPPAFEFCDRDLDLEVKSVDFDLDFLESTFGHVPTHTQSRSLLGISW